MSKIILVGKDIELFDNNGIPKEHIGINSLNEFHSMVRNSTVIDSDEFLERLFIKDDSYDSFNFDIRNSVFLYHERGIMFVKDNETNIYYIFR